MLIVGDYTCIDAARDCITDLKVYNLSSLVEGYTQLTNLIPNRGVYLGDDDYSIRYCNYIWNNDNVYLSFMTIMLNLYEGNDVYLIVTRNEFYDNLTESLLTIIKNRYGYCGLIINEKEDLKWITTNYDFGRFTEYGLIVLDNDRIKFMSILAANNMIKEEDYD